MRSRVFAAVRSLSSEVKSHWRQFMSQFWDLKSLAFRRPLPVRRTELGRCYRPRNSVVIEWAWRLGYWFSPGPITVGFVADFEPTGFMPAVRSLAGTEKIVR